MAKFTADIPETRYYPTLGIEVNPGDVVELPEDTEAYGLTLVVDAPAKASKATSKTDATPAPAETPAPETTDAPATEGVTN